MSRGPGITQRAVLDGLSEEWLSVDDVLTTLNQSLTAGRSERESIRRAMRTLAVNGQARLRHDAHGELQVSEPLDLETRKILGEVHAVEASGGDGWQYLLRHYSLTFGGQHLGKD